MTEPKLATKKRSGRWYTLPAGGDYPSVTTILNVLDKPALVRWAAKEVAESAWSKRKALAAMNATDYEDAVKMLKGSPWSKRDKAADLGTDVHGIAEALLRGTDLPDVSSQAEPYVDALLQAVKDLDLSFEYLEATVGNRAAGYAGTLDSIGVSGVLGKRLVLDIKTGKGVYPETALQINAYGKAEVIVIDDYVEAVEIAGNDDWAVFETVPIKQHEEPMPEVEGGGVLHLKPNGKFDIKKDFYPVVIDDKTFEVFKALRMVWRWNEEDAKEALG